MSLTDVPSSSAKPQQPFYLIAVSGFALILHSVLQLNMNAKIKAKHVYIKTVSDTTCCLFRVMIIVAVLAPIALAVVKALELILCGTYRVVRPGGLRVFLRAQPQDCDHSLGSNHRLSSTLTKSSLGKDSKPMLRNSDEDPVSMLDETIEELLDPARTSDRQMKIGFFKRHKRYLLL